MHGESKRELIMKKKTKVQSLFDREMSKAEFRAHFEKEHSIFKIEVQMLAALERQGITYEQLAKTLHTTKGNISRDLRQGGIAAAKVGRIQRMADALGLAFIPLMLPKNKVPSLLPQLEKLVIA